ncbi:MAG: exodeoxyribonuclease VII large subunit, partial [Steroidobacteraceae bacterium]
AAELVAPDRQEVQLALGKTASRLHVACSRELRALAARIASADACLKLAHPGARIEQQAQRLDDVEQRLAGALRTHLHRDHQRLTERFARLIRHSPEHRVREYRMRCEALAAQLQHAQERIVSGAVHRFDLAVCALESVSPLRTLTRGYAIVTRAADGGVLSDADSVTVGEEIEARLAHGRLRARVTGKLGG